MGSHTKKIKQKSTTYITMALLFLFNISFAQDLTKSPDGAFPPEELKGFTQTIYYSAGYEKRAKDIAVFLELAGNYFQQQIGFTPKTKLYILGPEQWKDFAAEPLKDVYGFPHNPDPVSLVIAAADNDFWRSFLPPVEQLPQPIAAQVKEAYGKSDGSYSMMPFFDLLALHEMGHSYTAQAGLKMHRNWMGELFVNIMLHTFIAETKPELLPALETFPNMVINGGTEAYKYTSLEDFEKLYSTMGMGPQNYGWYQCKLHSAAKDIYNAGGKRVLKKIWKAMKKHQETMSDEELVVMLKKEVHPAVANVYLQWNRY